MFDKSLKDYLNKYYHNLEVDINNFNDDKILSANFEEWAEYFFAKYELEFITWYPDNTTRNIKEGVIETPTMVMGWRGPEHTSIKEASYEITFGVPFEGNVDLFRLDNDFLTVRTVSYPSPNYDAIIKEPNDDKLGCLTFVLDFKQKDALADADKFKATVDNAFKAELQKYTNKLEVLRTKTTEFNNALKSNIIKLLTERKTKAENKNKVAQVLNIPLKLNPNAPNTTPVPLKRIIKTPIKQPVNKPIAPEYCIDDKDFKNIANIINMSAISMEATPSSYLSLDEEALRDVILATLNTHYQSTGERFHKSGKTDIMIEFENKAAYIGECKIWHGLKLFNEAITQLKSYTTWRDTKVSIIIFNRNNSKFVELLETIRTWAKENTTNITQQEKNIWNCSLTDKDTSQVYQLHIAVYDLYIKKQKGATANGC